MVTSAWIIEQGRAVGFDKVGVAPASALPELEFFPEWLARGYAGELDYLRQPRRRDVRELLPAARSVICCALAYDTRPARSTEVPFDPERGWLSRYAWGDDYHAIVEEKLEALRARLAAQAGTEFQAKLYVDTGPVLERVYGRYAGLGWQAKNTCLLDTELGSFFFIGVLVTNLELEPSTPLPDGCGACTLCIEACPTGAIVEPYMLDARRCLSYLTIELRGSIPEEFRPALGRHVFGCDICQDVCPYNRRAWVTDAVAFQPRRLETEEQKTIDYRQSSRSQQAPRPAQAATGECLELEYSQAENRSCKRGTKTEKQAEAGVREHRAACNVQEAQDTEHEARSTLRESLFHPRLDWLASLSEEEFQRLFKNSAVKRAKWRGLLRNVLVAMGNSGNPRFRPILEKFVASGDPLLAEHAKWALARIGEET